METHGWAAEFGLAHSCRGGVSNQDQSSVAAAFISRACPSPSIQSALLLPSTLKQTHSYPTLLSASIVQTLRLTHPLPPYSHFLTKRTHIQNDWWQVRRQGQRLQERAIVSILPIFANLGRLSGRVLIASYIIDYHVSIVVL